MSRLIKPLVVLTLLAAGVGWFVFGPGTRRTDHRAAAESAAGRRLFTVAMDYLNDYFVSDPADRDAHLLAARVSRRLGDGTATAEHLRRYDELGGDREVLEIERALSRIEAGEPAGSGRVFDFCMKHPDHPAAPFALESLTIGMRKIGQPDRALRCAKEWLRVAATPADRAAAHVGRGQALAMKGLGAEAAQEYRLALAENPTDPEAQFHLAEFLSRDEPAEALALYRGLDAERLEVKLGLSRAHRQLGNHGAAVAIITPLLAARPDDADVMTEAGTLALDRGRADEAEYLLRRAVAKAPDRRTPNVQLLRCLQERGKTTEADAQRAKVKQIDDELEKRIVAMSVKP
jgi:tetratricopeptide (TPR) repeat protein